MHEALAGAAEDAALLRSRQAASRHPVAMNAAYLVAAAGRDRFMAVLEQLRHAHGPAYALELSGPWPGYSFTAVDVAGPRG